MDEFDLVTPITFIFFNRLDTTLKVFEVIRRAKPQKLYLISDGARAIRRGEQEIVEKVRENVENRIDWPCQVRKSYASENMGCRERVSSGISWVFEQEETTIILEDDVIPVPSFFRYCQELLIKYKDKEQVTYISGNNIYHNYEIKDSYVFSKYPSIWGWATWKRAWDLYDDSESAWKKIKDAGSVESYYGKKWGKFYSTQIQMAYTGEKDTWDYQWEASRMWKGGLGIIPQYNLIENIGFNRDDATHTQGECMYDFAKKDIEFPMRHPFEVRENSEYDRAYVKNIIAKEFERWTFCGKVARRVRMLFGG